MRERPTWRKEAAVELLYMESERDTHKRLSRWLMQNGEIFISLAACLGGAGQPTLYIS